MFFLKQAFCALCLIASPLVAADELVIPKIDGTPTLADFENMAPGTDLARSMVKVTDFIQREPVDGRPATRQTEVYLGHDTKTLYVIFLAFDDEPDKIRAHMVPREDINDDDTLNILIDSFNDQRRAYMFRCNPLGIQWDGTWSEQSSFDESFNAVWRSEGRVNDQGYQVRMAVPFKAFRFAGGDRQVWGIMFNRDIPRLNEEGYWPRYTNRIQGRLNQAQKTVIEGNLSQGRNHQYIPYATARSFELLDDDSAEFIDDDFDGDAGIDAKFVINDNMVVDVAANPDFSQVESDDPQITTNQRFEVFFPERRPFFLENADIFGGPINLVFTRRIADPSAGVRLTGKAGKYGIGTFVIDDEAPGKVAAPGSSGDGDRTHIGVVRITRDVLSQSKVGITYTGREFDDRWNHVFATDGRILVDENWSANYALIGSKTEDEDGTTRNGHLATFYMDREARNWDAHIHASDTHEEFETQLGFLRRVAQRPGLSNIHARTNYDFWPENSKIVNWGPAASYNYGYDRNSGKRLDAGGDVEMKVEMVGKTEIEIGFEFNKERVTPDDFDALVADKDFNYESLEFEFETARWKAAELGLSVAYGEEPNFEPAEGREPELADFMAARAGMQLRPIPPLRIDLTYLYIQLEDKEGGERIFEERIGRGRVNWQFTRELSMRMILQYESLAVDPLRTALERERGINGDLLFTWLVNPWTSLYVGYNSNWRNVQIIDDEFGRRVIRTDSDLEKDAHQFFLKFSYLL
ncbi:MAG: DUF5916 domain-containing protein [Acidobacteriota bacterium]|nr:DUF5916 domain-containing protein [Acidobacteriota bacterium]